MSRDRWLAAADRVGLGLIWLFVASMVALLAAEAAVGLLALAFISGGAYALGWVTTSRRPGARPLTFDEHTATAAAILQPDHPLFDDDQERQIAQVADTDTPFADAVEQELAAHTNRKPTTPEEN